MREPREPLDGLPIQALEAHRRTDGLRWPVARMEHAATRCLGLRVSNAGFDLKSDRSSAWVSAWSTPNDLPPRLHGKRPFLHAPSRAPKRLFLERAHEYRSGFQPAAHRGRGRSGGACLGGQGGRAPDRSQLDFPNAARLSPSGGHWFSYNYPTAISAGSGSTADSISFAYGPELPAPAISPRRPEDDITGRFLSPDTHIPDSATNKARILSRYNPMLDKISAKERVSMRRLRRQTGLRDTS